MRHQSDSQAEEGHSTGTSHSQDAKAESLMRSWVCTAIVVYLSCYLFKGGRRESGGDPRGDE